MKKEYPRVVELINLSLNGWTLRVVVPKIHTHQQGQDHTWDNLSRNWYVDGVVGDKTSYRKIENKIVCPLFRRKKNFFFSFHQKENYAPMKLLFFF